MPASTDYSTPHEHFWAGEFGDSYVERNRSAELIAANVSMFSDSLAHAGPISSAIEFGANIGNNLRALKVLFPAMKLRGIEINAKAAEELATFIGNENVIHKSILDADIGKPVDLAFIKGVLIHINPDSLPLVYDRLYAASNRYILLVEYYNPTPVAVSYRGHENRLFKRDFAGEIMDRFTDVTLVDYGFRYRRDPVFPQDDLTWFLMRKA